MEATVMGYDHEQQVVAALDNLDSALGTLGPRWRAVQRAVSSPSLAEPARIRELVEAGSYIGSRLTRTSKTP
jgi:hypothetical protein